MVPISATPDRAAELLRGAERLGGAASRLGGHRGQHDIPQREIKDIARSQRAVSLRHPYVVRISIGRIPMGPNALRYSERTLAILRAAGLPPKLAVQGSHLLISTVNGFTLDETGVDGQAAGGAQDAISATAADLASSYFAALPSQRFPNLVSLADEFRFADPDERFELLIDIFVDGLARLAGPAGHG